MNLGHIALASTAPLVICGTGLVIFFLQIRIHSRSAGFVGNLWGALIALCSAMYALGSFISSNAGTVTAARLSTQLQYSALVLIVLCLVGYTQSYLGLQHTGWHLAVAAVTIVFISLTWCTDLIATRAIEPVAYLLMPGEHWQTTLGLLEPALVVYVAAGGLVLAGFWIAKRKQKSVSGFIIGAFVFWLILGIWDALGNILSFFATPFPLVEYGTFGFSCAVLSQSLRDYFALFDLAERRRLGLEQARSEAEAASRAKSAFLANMSHELRTPLNHIIGFTELVASREIGPLNDTQEEYLTDSLASSRHLLSLINDVLDISKVEAGKMTLALEDVDLGTLLRESLTVVADAAAEKSIRVEISIDALPRIVADERKLKQVFYNLLSNAVKFTPQGGRVTLSARTAAASGGGEGVEITVRDTGIGLRTEDLQKIFDPFHQVDGSSTRSHTGTGLGLSLSRELVSLHGGRILAESPGSGGGAVFTVLLPVRSR